jgi:CheY-like chemotaxis protein
MSCLLIVEDRLKDLSAAVALARSAGFSNIETRNSAGSARLYLEKAMDGGPAMPEAIVLDLELGSENGSELLRFWHSQPRLAEIPMVIWTSLDGQREMCRLFKVTAFIAKDDVGQLGETLAKARQTRAARAEM